MTGGAIDVFDHPGLFIVSLDQPRAMPAAAKTLEQTVLRAERVRDAMTDRRHNSTRHRYCLSCARETEHVGWIAVGRGSIPLIRWPAAEPPTGTTICLNCGQWRTATSQARLPSAN